MGPACEGLQVGQASSQLSQVGQDSSPLVANFSFQIHEMGLNHPNLERRGPLPLTSGRCAPDVGVLIAASGPSIQPVVLSPCRLPGSGLGTGDTAGLQAWGGQAA